MSSLFLSQMSWKSRCYRRGNSIHCVSSLSETNTDSRRRSRCLTKQPFANQCFGPVVREIQQGVHAPLYKLRRWINRHFSLSWMRRVSLLELYSSPSPYSSDQRSPYSVSWYSSGRQTEPSSSFILSPTCRRNVHVLLRTLRWPHLPRVYNFGSSWS